MVYLTGGGCVNICAGRATGGVSAKGLCVCCGGAAGGAGGAAAGCSRRSRFTSDEFSPRNADGDFFMPAAPAGDDGFGVRLSPVVQLLF